jgi:glycosyltransferase involved in cell wall biosynthesis
MTPVADRQRREGGRRAAGKQRSRVEGKPLVSVVTIVRNGEAFVAATLRSVVGQTYPNVEFIVVDGGSTDKTLDVVTAFDDRIDYWLSEPDKGIYDAMNKGAAFATGAWVCFMNAGDIFFGNDSIARIFDAFPAEAELIYGGCEVDYGTFRRRIDAGDVEDLWKGMAFSHQSLFARTALVRSHPFDTRHGTAADFGFVLRMREEGRVFHRVSQAVSVVDAHGISDAKRVETLRSTASIVRQHGLGLAPRLYFAHRIALETLKGALKQVLGERIVRRILRYQAP